MTTSSATPATATAMNTAIVSATVILSGINTARSAADVTPSGLLVLKFAMLILPAILIALGYAVWRAKFRIDEALHARIVTELAARGDLGDGLRQALASEDQAAQAAEAAAAGGTGTGTGTSTGSGSGAPGD